MASKTSANSAIGLDGANISTTISSKATYSEDISKKLAETKTKVKKVNEKIRNAVTAGRIEANEQLALAQQAVESKLISAEEQLTRLRKANETGWQDRRKDTEDFPEYLSRSIKNLVDRFSDRLR